MDNDIVISTPVRSAIGTFGGSFKDTPSVDIGAHVINSCLQRAGIDADAVDSVIMGNVIQAGGGMNVARQAAVKAGLNVSKPALTVNRVCGSGAQAVISAYSEIKSGLARVIVAGGMENMERAPYLLPTMRAGSRMGDVSSVDSMLRDGLNDAFSGRHSGWHTEDLVTEFKLTRADQDRYAAQSQERFAAAQSAGYFTEQIAPMTLQTKKGETLFSVDEGNRPETTIESLARLKPAFRPDGTVTAGNAPGVNAGAAAMLVSELGVALELGLRPMAYIRSVAVVGVDPNKFGLGPIPAIRMALHRAGWTVDEVNRFEVNEAFAAIALIVKSELGIDSARFNVDGGAIAHGHPIGASGAILMTKLLHAMQRTGEKKGVVSLCIGGGQGIALCVEMVA